MSKILEALEHAQADARGWHARNLAPERSWRRSRRGVRPGRLLPGEHGRGDGPPPPAPRRHVSGPRQPGDRVHRITRRRRHVHRGWGVRPGLGSAVRAACAPPADRPARSRREVIGDESTGAAAHAAPAPAGTGTLDVAPFPPELLAVSHTGESQGPAAIWAPLRAAYDLILVDAPPATTSPQGLAVSRQVDGAVLVIAAEETRWPVAERVKQSIERSGGRVLGVVLNKRKYHIPRWMYQRL